MTSGWAAKEVRDTIKVTIKMNRTLFIMHTPLKIKKPRRLF